MDFIERLFGISPDGGSGAFEFVLFAIPIAGICYLALRRRNRKSKKNRADTDVPQSGSDSD